MKSAAPTDTQSGMTGVPPTMDFMVSSLLLCGVQVYAQAHAREHKIMHKLMYVLAYCV